MVTRAYAPDADAKIWSEGTTAATTEAPARMFRDYLQPGDRILADKGTLLQAYLDKLRLEVRSTLPPFAHDGQLTDKEADRGFLISRRRYSFIIVTPNDRSIIIEDIFARMKVVIHRLIANHRSATRF